MDKPSAQTLKDNLHQIMFEADTPTGKVFDVSLLVLIVLSVFIVMIESVDSIAKEHEHLFYTLEWIITIIFTIEYLLRIYCVTKPWKYIKSFYGIVDLLSILPTYISPFLAGTQYLMVVRALRLLRIFRIFKLGRYLGESLILITALKASRVKITVFLGAVLTAAMIIGSFMYLIEADQNPTFSSIPKSIYWAIVTITTVGYGDIAPITAIGQFFAAVLMLVGYCIIAVPTGIVSVELAQAQTDAKVNTRSCHHCSEEGHDNDAVYCKYCGEKMRNGQSPLI